MCISMKKRHVECSYIWKMNDQENQDFFFKALSKLKKDVIETVLHWMGTHRKNRMIQVLGCGNIASLRQNEILEFPFVSMPMWTRILDILNVHQKDSIVVISIFTIFRYGIKHNILRQIGLITDAFDKETLIQLTTTISNVIKLYLNHDFVNCISLI